MCVRHDEYYFQWLGDPFCCPAVSHSELGVTKPRGNTAVLAMLSMCGLSKVLGVRRLAALRVLNLRNIVDVGVLLGRVCYEKPGIVAGEVTYVATLRFSIF